MNSSIAKGMKFLPDINADRTVAIIVWLIGVWSTREALIAMRPDIGAAVTLMAALALQWIFTVVERRVWNKKMGFVPFLALVLDTLANAGGMLPYIRNFGASSVWTMLQEVAVHYGLVAAPPTFELATAVAMCIALGFAVARAPEQLWSN